MAIAPSVIINLPSVPFNVLESAATIAALRALPSAQLDEGDNIAVDGGVASGDGDGGLYTWSELSTVSDDGLRVIKPTDVPPLSAGRWILTNAGWSAGLSALRSDLAAPTGSTLIGFRQAGTNPLARTVQDELRRTIDASQFTGFDPTGATDSTVAIQNALNLCSTLGGGKVTIPDGVRVLICSTTSLTIPEHCTLQGPHLHGVDNNGTNLSYPWGTMGGTLVHNAGGGRHIVCKGAIDGFLIHRPGITFPVTTAESGYVSDAIHLAGDGASASNCMILGYSRAVYSRKWQRLFCYNLKIDCSNGIDFRQTADTSIIFKCDGWPYAGGGTNALNTRSGAFIHLAGKNDWTQVIQCQEYGYLYGYDIQNEADDDTTVWGPANVRIIDSRSDDGWDDASIPPRPCHTGKIGVRIGTGATPAKSYDVYIKGLQSSCAAVAAVYSNVEAGMCTRVIDSQSWNGPQYGLLYQKGGDAIVMGGGNDGSGPIDPNIAYTSRAPVSQYSIAYDVVAGAGRLTIGGGFRSAKVTVSHFRTSVAVDSFNIDWDAVSHDTSAPLFDNPSSTLPTIASAADMSALLLRPEKEFFLSGNATITNLGVAPKGKRIGFICTAASGPTFTNNSNMRVNGAANFTVTVAGTYVEFVGTGTQWRMTGAPST